MKITADMLTEEMGFIPGAIIQVETNTGFISTDILRKVGRESVLYAQCEIPENPGYIHGYYPFECIKSIKVLTGPMSIWNYAPEWAVSMNLFTDGHAVEWYNEDQRRIGSFERPWWCN